MKKIILLILIIIIFFGIFGWLEIYLPKNPFLRLTVFFELEKGWGAKEIAYNLEKAGIIRCGLFFRAFVYSKGVSGKLKAGEYELSPAMNIPEIVEKLVSGEVTKKTITIIEGWTVKDIEEYLKVEKIDPNLEGYLFPDTYEILPGEGIEEIIEKMRDNFDNKVRSRFGEELSTEIITMASLLEKEVRTSEDKKIVSGILWKRLEIGMPLQVDAALDTYKYKGLPQSPICNPGLESIEAAIYPQENSYLYYLSAPDGKTIFSKTLKEHNIAKEKYLK